MLVNIVVVVKVGVVIYYLEGYWGYVFWVYIYKFLIGYILWCGFFNCECWVGYQIECGSCYG